MAGTDTCIETGTAIKTHEYIGDDPLGFMVSLNLKRRHLDTAQRAMMASRLANMQHGRIGEVKISMPKFRF